MKEMTEAQQKAKALLYEPAYASDKDAATRQAAAAFGEGYKDFLTRCKTEREVAAYAEEALKAAGYQLYDDRKQYAAGDKIYWIHQGKVVLCGTIGTRSMEDGFHLVIAHIDAPRLDIRPNPLYEAAHFSLLKTHYYGGIRKYQWATMPLAIHGVFTRADGSSVTVRIGEEPGDPVFCITDLLPHLGQEQGERPLKDGIKGEELNVLIGSEAVADDQIKEKVKLNTMLLLNEKYGITEKDFVRAEIEVVPAHKAQDVGFDRSMVGGYGHDDRVDGYAGLRAEIECKNPAYTTVCVLADKEEIGSEGVSGMQSAFFDTFVEDLCESQNVPLRACYEKSFCLSSDVTAAFDPNFAEVYERNNSAFVNYGVGLSKYTGARGKGGCSDAGAEAVGYIRRLLDDLRDKVFHEAAAPGAVKWMLRKFGHIVPPIRQIRRRR